MSNARVQESDDLPFGLQGLPSGMIREIRETREMAEAFNQEVVRHRSLEIDQKVEDNPNFLPWDLVHEANKRGFYTLWIPKAFGGKGYSPLSMLAFSEILGSECLGIANLIGAHYVGIALMSATFNFKVLQRICNSVVEGEQSGKPCLLSTAITEPDAGTDLEDIELIDRGRIHSRAEKVKGGYLLNGTKVFISNAHLSSWHIVIAHTDIKRPSESSVVLALSSKTPGFSLGRIEGKMGQNACPASVLSFDNCFIPDEYVCLAPDSSHSPETKLNHRNICAMLVDDVLSLSRPGVAALGAGAALGAYQEALRHCSKTQLGHAPLLNQEWVQCILAEMYKNVKMSQYCFWDAGLQIAFRGPFHMLQNQIIFSLLKILPQKLLQSLLTPLVTSSSSRRTMLQSRIEIQNKGWDKHYSGSSSLAKFAASDLAMENCNLALKLMGRSCLR